MAKKQKSFADKAAGLKDQDAVYVKYVKSVKSDKTGQWRFNEQMVRTSKGEQLDVALKRLDEAAMLTDIDLSEFESAEAPAEEVVAEVVETTENAVEESSPEPVEEASAEDEGAAKEIEEPQEEEK